MEFHNVYKIFNLLAGLGWLKIYSVLQKWTYLNIRSKAGFKKTRIKNTQSNSNISKKALLDKTFKKKVEISEKRKGKAGSWIQPT